MKAFQTTIFLNLLFLFTFCNGQEKNGSNITSNLTEDTKKNFVVGNYMIVPEKKEVRLYTMIGGVNWDGYEYRKDQKIDYEKTTLLALGDRIFFKEYFPFDFDLEKLKIIHRDKFYFLCKDDKNIYYISERIKPTKIDISNYETVNDFIEVIV